MRWDLNRWGMNNVKLIDAWGLPGSVVTPYEFVKRLFKLFFIAKEPEKLIQLACNYRTLVNQPRSQLSSDLLKDALWRHNQMDIDGFHCLLGML